MSAIEWSVTRAVPECERTAPPELLSIRPLDSCSARSTCQWPPFTYRSIRLPSIHILLLMRVYYIALMRQWDDWRDTLRPLSTGSTHSATITTIHWLRAFNVRYVRYERMCWSRFAWIASLTHYWFASLLISRIPWKDRHQRESYGVIGVRGRGEESVVSQ